MAQGRGAYNRTYLRQRSRREKKETLKKKLHRLGWILLGCVLAAAVVISIAQAMGWRAIPTWNDLYAALHLQAAQPVSAQQNGAAAQVTFLDVGQGDAVLLETDGQYCLIDAGTPESEDALLSQLDAAGVQELALLVMTHQHGDHIGGMSAVLEKYPVKQVLLPDFTLTKEDGGAMLAHVLSVILREKIPAATAAPGQVYPLGSGSLTVLSAGVSTEEPNANNDSVITMFSAHGLRYLSCGDAEQPELDALAASGQDLRADVYKATHHGSADSNTEAFLRAVQPRFVAVSCGKDNDFGHPHREALAAFAAVGAKVYRTDEDGAVMVWAQADGSLQARRAQEPAGGGAAPQSSANSAAADSAA